MARIVGINSVNYIDKRKLESKLSFKEGEKFFAKVCSSDKKTGEVVLKLPNGWEFKAEIEDAASKETLEFMEGKVLKFKVEDFVNGKIQLSLPEEISNEDLTSSLKNILGRLNLPDNQENIELLEKMIKHDITLDKDNVYIFKNLMFIKQRIGQNSEEIDKLMRLFLIKCNISEDTDEAQFIKNNLKEFFNVLKNTDNDVLLSLKENGLEVLSKENIDSMVQLNEETNVIEKSITELFKAFKNCKKEEVDSKVFTKNEYSNNSKSQLGTEISKMQLYKDIESLMGNEDMNDVQTEINNFLQEMDYQGDENNKKSSDITLKTKEPAENNSMVEEANTGDNKVIDQKLQHKDEGNNFNNTSSNSEEKNIEPTQKKMFIINHEKNIVSDKPINSTEKNTTLSKETINELSNMVNDNDQLRDTIVKNLDLHREFNLNSGNDLISSETLTAKDIEKMDINQAVKKILLDSLVVKENISEKINDIKRLIREVIDIKQGIDEVSQKTVMQTIKESVNNLKVINSITDQYYYLDTPIKINDKNHEFKLIIKNNNKKSHDFDTKCVKIFASIKAPKLGYVDNFITINNTNMQIRICCNKNYMKAISSRKSELIESVSLIGYMPTVIVEEKMEETNISNSSEFFQDQTFTMINQLI